MGPAPLVAWMDPTLLTVTGEVLRGATVLLLAILFPLTVLAAIITARQRR